MEECIKPPHAAEPRAERDLRRRQRCFLQQLLREKQALGLHDFHGRDAKGLHHQAPQLPRAEPGVTRELLHRIPLDRPFADRREKRLLERDRRHRRSQLRAAPQAGAKTSMLGLRRRLDEHA